MAHSLQLQIRTKGLLEEIRSKAKDINKEKKLLVFSFMEETYEGLVKPDVKFTLADKYPAKESYNNNFIKAKSLLDKAETESKYLRTNLSNTFDQNIISQMSIDNRIKKLEDVAFEAKNSLAKRSGNKIIFRDSFLNHEHYDRVMAGEYEASISLKEASLTLKQLEGEEFSKATEIKINEASNGFPGNTHQVHITNNEVEYDGEEAPHINPSAIIDYNTDTWFEYEMWSADPDLYEELHGIGLNYSEGINWLKRDFDELRLSLTVKVEDAPIINWISIAPFIPPDKGAGFAVIDRIIIDDGQGNRQTIGAEESLNEDKVYLFPKQKIMYIHLEFSQKNKYRALAGRKYYRESLPEEASVVGKIIPGPTTSVESLGISFDAAERKLKYDWLSSNQEISISPSILKEIFSIDSSGNRLGFLEAINAYRFQIGLRNISAALYRFNTESVYISKSFKTDDPITSVSIETIDEIPTVFPQGEWIKYYISINDGESWHEISPHIALPEGKKTKYIINSSTPAALRNQYYGYLDIINEVNDIRVKIELSRPTTIEDPDYYSPIIKEYSLVVETGGE